MVGQCWVSAHSNSLSSDTVLSCPQISPLFVFFFNWDMCLSHGKINQTVTEASSSSNATKLLIILSNLLNVWDSFDLFLLAGAGFHIGKRQKNNFWWNINKNVFLKAQAVLRHLYDSRQKNPMPIRSFQREYVYLRYHISDYVHTKTHFSHYHCLLLQRSYVTSVGTPLSI